MSQIEERASPRYAVIDLKGSKHRAWNGNYADFFRQVRDEFAVRSSQNLEEAIRTAASAFIFDLLGQEGQNGKGFSHKMQEAFTTALENHRDTMSESDVAAAIEREEDRRQRLKAFSGRAKDILADLEDMALTGPPNKIARLMELMRDLASNKT